MLDVLKTFSNFNTEFVDDNIPSHNQETNTLQSGLIHDVDLRPAYDEFKQYLIDKGYSEENINNIYSVKKGTPYISVKKCKKYLSLEQIFILASQTYLGNVRLEKRKIFGHKVADNISINNRQYNVYENTGEQKTGLLIGYIPVINETGLKLIEVYKKKRSLYDYTFYTVFIFIIADMIAKSMM